MSPFLKGFIALSVLLNLLLAGIIIGHFSHYFVNYGKHLTMQQVAAAFSPDKRERFAGMLSHADQDISALRRQLSDTRKSAAVILKAEPFDKTAYNAKIEEIQHLKMQILQRMTDTVTTLAGQAAPQERAKMAEILFPSN